MALTVDSASLRLNEILSPLRRTEEVLSFVGIFYVGKFALKVIRDIVSGLRVHLWSKLASRRWVEQYGRWAVVTGATHGIGKGYAYELAKKGMNIVLVSHNQEKLENVAQKIGDEYGVQTEIVKADFSSDWSVIYGTVGKHLAGKEIGILVNNAEVMSSYPTLFENLSEDDLWAQVHVNVGSVPAMTKLVLPSMKRRKKGAVINISTAGGMIPLFHVYTATKSFVSSFSEAVEFECRSFGITVQTITPGVVSTTMLDEELHKEGFFTPSPARFAAHALSTLGYAQVTTGYWTHSIQLWFIQRIPSSLLMHGCMWKYQLGPKKTS